MIERAYKVNYDTQNYHASVVEGSELEVQASRENLIRDNLVRYVGEYRLGEKFDEYYYSVIQDSDTGEKYFTSGNNSPIIDTYKRAISERLDEGLDASREIAECVGFESLERKLSSAPDGTMAVWVSPPGESEQGYGDYSFTFIAQVVDSVGGRRIRMIPYRNEFGYGEHNTYLEKLTGREISLDKDIDYLASPFIVKAGELYTPEDVLDFIGEQEEFTDSWREEFYLKAQPIIQWYINLVKENASDSELKKALYALENFAIAYKDNKDVALYDRGNVQSEAGYLDTAHVFVESWGREAPPIARGSCGATGDETTTPMEMQKEFGKKERILCCTCPFCNEKVEAVIRNGRIKCPRRGCGRSAKWSD